MRNVIYALLLLTPIFVNAEIYKWIDDNGVTHYGRKPNNENHEKLDINENQSKPIPEGVQKLAEQLVLKGRGDSEKVDCSKAVSNALSGLNTMIKVGTKNYRDGYIPKAEYDKSVGALKKIKSEVSISKCKSATGNELAFYKCTTNYYNHVAHCGQKHMSN